MHPSVPAFVVAALLWAGTAVAAGNGQSDVGKLMRAAEAGEAQAQYELGLAFLTGDGVTQDDSAAVHWFTLAAAAGLPSAQGNLGFLYLQGRGVPRDPQQAVQWLRQAAGKDVAAAQHNLGWMAQVGEGMPVDAETAIKWYAAAAGSGFSPSQFNLGTMLADGRDPAGAVKWLSLAALSPRVDVRRRASDRLLDLSRELPPQQVAEGLEDARRWLASGWVY